jgi:hypothetical protein
MPVRMQERCARRECQSGCLRSPLRTIWWWLTCESAVRLLDFVFGSVSLEVEGGVERVSLGGSLVHMLVVVAVASCSSVERWVVFPLVLTAVFESRLAEMRSARPVRHGSGKQVVSSSRWTVARTEASDLLARERASRRRVAAPL